MKKHLWILVRDDGHVLFASDKRSVVVEQQSFCSGFTKIVYLDKSLIILTNE